jgi:hypothetical protein
MSQIREYLQIEDLYAYEQWWVITMKVNKQNILNLNRLTHHCQNTFQFLKARPSLPNS